MQEVLRILLSPTVDGYRGIIRPSEIPSRDDEQDVVLSGQHIEDVRQSPNVSTVVRRVGVTQ
ncbi:hypothetical protein D3C76_1866890 [compost metagenome]